MLFITTSGCWVSRGTYHIPVFLFLVPLIFFCPFLWTGIYCLSSVMVHPSSHKNPIEIYGAVFIFGKTRIWHSCLLRPDSRSVTMCEDSIVLPYGSLAVISFDIITGRIFVVACFARFIFAPESAIASMLLLVGLGGVKNTIYETKFRVTNFNFIHCHPQSSFEPFLTPSQYLLVVGLISIADFFWRIRLLYREYIWFRNSNGSISSSNLFG